MQLAENILLELVLEDLLMGQRILCLRLIMYIILLLAEEIP